MRVWPEILGYESMLFLDVAALHAALDIQTVAIRTHSASRCA